MVPTWRSRISAWPSGPLRVGVEWEDYREDDLGDAVSPHFGGLLASWPGTLDVLASHGVTFDDLDVAWVGVQTFVVAYLGNPLGEAAGNHRLRSGRDLLYAADAASPILKQVVGAVVETRQAGQSMVCGCPAAMAGVR